LWIRQQHTKDWKITDFKGKKRVVVAMRLSLAAAILLQANPAVLSAETAVKESQRDLANSPNFEDSSFAQNAANEERRVQHRAASLFKKFPLDAVRSNLLAKRTILKNQKQNHIECDPTSADPDVGILSCPPDKSFCLEDPASDHGGVCVAAGATRRMATHARPPLKRSVYCDPSSPYFGVLNCDCSGFNLETNKGTFKCTSDSYCFGAVAECCGNTCADITMTYSSTGPYSYNYETCYSFQTPYKQSFCYGQHVDRNNATQNCFGSFNGQTCDSCVMASENCTLFDCSTSGLEGGFCLEEFYPPVLTNCYAECSTCTICPSSHNRSVANPNAVLGFTDLTCGYVEFLGGTGFWGGSTNQTCLNVKNAVQKTCCESGGNAQGGNASNAPAPTWTGNQETPAPTVMPAAPSTFKPSEYSNNPGNVSTMVTCNIRIQTSKCAELLTAHSGVIPCYCHDKCISFVDNEFQKCDSGNNIAGSGILVAGCTFDMTQAGTINCTKSNATTSGAVQGHVTRTMQLALLSLPLLVYFF